jgi:hypothetical protein
MSSKVSKWAVCRHQQSVAVQSINRHIFPPKHILQVSLNMALVPRVPLLPEGPGGHHTSGPGCHDLPLPQRCRQLAWLGGAVLITISAVNAATLDARGCCAHCRWYHLPQQGHADERQKPVPFPCGFKYGYELLQLACSWSC